MNPSAGASDPDLAFLGETHNEVLRALTEGTRIVGEVDRGIEHFEQFCQCLERLVKSRGAARVTRMVWRQYPAAGAAYLVLAGAYHYAHGEYWPYALAVLGAPAPPYQTLWGRSYLQFLHVFGLTAFDQGGRRYLRRILGHAMVPNDCLPEFFEELLEPAVRSPAWMGLEPRELIAEWLRHPAFAPGVDKPVWQFLRHGGEVAERLVAGAMQMAKGRHKSGQVGSPNELGLPERVVRAYLEWLDSPKAACFASRSPVLYLDPYGSVHLHLPEQRPIAGRAGQNYAWTVVALGESLRDPRDVVREVEASTAVPAGEMEVPPAPHYMIELQVGGHTEQTWALDGVTEDRRWKVFSQRTGNEIDASRPVRGEPTWFLLPHCASARAIDAADVPVKEALRQESYLVGEWSDYQALLIDLSGASRVEVQVGDCTETIEVQFTERPCRLESGDVLQSSELHPDCVDLYSDTPPALVIPVPPGEETDAADALRVRIDSQGVCGRQSTPAPRKGIETAAELRPGEVVLSMAVLVPTERRPCALTATVWWKGKRRGSVGFTWVPGLRWDWHGAGRRVNIHMPQGARLRSRGDDGEYREVARQEHTCVVALREGRHDLDVQLAWDANASRLFTVNLRLEGPRWALLTDSAGTVEWHTAAAEIDRELLLQTRSPRVLLEFRDPHWATARAQAEIAVPGDASVCQVIRDASPRRHGRWLFLLGEALDTIRHSPAEEFLVRAVAEPSHARRSAPLAVELLRIPAQHIPQYHCTRCDFADTQVEVCEVHIRSAHFDELFPPLQYDELRDALPHLRLPHAIFRCSYCSAYVRSDDLRTPSSAICAHIDTCADAERRMGVPEYRFHRIKDIDEIRETVLRNLPRLRKCKICGTRIGDDGVEQQMEHLLENHWDDLWRLS